MQCRACCEIVLERDPGILRGEDGEACDERARFAGRGVVVRGGEVEPRQHFAGGSGVFHRLKRSPGDRVFVEVSAFWNSVHFVSPFAGFDCGVAGDCCENAGALRCSVGAQMLHEAMFFHEAFGVANGARMALDEDSSEVGLDYACSGERAGAGG